MAWFNTKSLWLGGRASERDEVWFLFGTQKFFFASYAQVTLASRLINIPLICPTHVGFFVVKLFSTRNKFCSRDMSVLMQVSLNLIMSTLCPITDRKWHFPFNYLSVMLTPLITALLLPFGEPTYYQWDLNNFGMVLIQ